MIVDNENVILKIYQGINKFQYNEENMILICSWVMIDKSFAILKIVRKKKDIKYRSLRKKYLTGEDIDMLRENKNNQKRNICDSHIDGA